MFDMINIFETFLPQLLRYPNPQDPLNGEAAALMLREPNTYERKVKDYVTRHASKHGNEEEGENEESDGDMSPVEDYDSEAEEDEPAGAMDDI
ncbi:MAG: hypothetical protein Q9227_001985 [Pyrenula ochraceoflavens]